MYKIRYFLCAITFYAYLNGMNPQLPGNVPTEVWAGIFTHYLSLQSQLNLMQTCCSLRNLYKKSKQIYFDHGTVANFKNYAYQDCTGMEELCAKIAVGKIRGSITLTVLSDQQRHYFIAQIPHTYKHITALHFVDRSFTDHHLSTLHEQLHECVFIPLKSLTIHKSTITSKALLHLQNFRYLEELDISHNQYLTYFFRAQYNDLAPLDEQAFNSALHITLSIFNTLKRLSINNCNLNDEHIATLPSLLEGKTDLEQLSVPHNYLTRNMKEAIIKSISKAQKTFLLDFGEQYF